MMGSRNSYAPIAVAIALLVVLQIVLIAVDCRQTPIATAEKFARNFFYLDPAMQEQLCAQLAGNGEAVREYIYVKTSEFGRRGFGPNYARRMFTKIHLDTLKQDDATARIHIAGDTRTAINPAMMVIGKWFHLGETYPIEMTLDLVKENGRWRVCTPDLDRTI